MSCPAPVTNRFLERECPACRRTWDPWEGRPHCSGNPQILSKEIADRELRRMRQILKSENSASHA